MFLHHKSLAAKHLRGNSHKEKTPFLFKRFVGGELLILELQDHDNWRFISDAEWYVTNGISQGDFVFDDPGIEQDILRLSESAQMKGLHGLLRFACYCLGCIGWPFLERLIEALHESCWWSFVYFICGYIRIERDPQQAPCYSAASYLHSTAFMNGGLFCDRMLYTFITQNPALTEFSVLPTLLMELVGNTLVSPGVRPPKHRHVAFGVVTVLRRVTPR